MVKVADFIYYNLLKHGKILAAILGLIVFVLVYMYISKWMVGFEEITTNSALVCNEDVDCFYWCDECVSIASTKVCRSEYKKCVCVNGLCELAT